MTVLTGVGLGLRRDFIDSFLNLDTYPDFIEVAPENWMDFGGR
ncbi:multinuclear nonheme iron-dependent oxidase, partial [Acinetobacter baumannii]